MAQLRPKIVKLAKIIGGVTGITTKIDENAPEYYCMAGILSDDEADIAIAAGLRKERTAGYLAKKVGKTVEEVQPLLDNLVYYGIFRRSMDKALGEDVYYMQIFAPGILEMMVNQKELLETHPEVGRAFDEYTRNLAANMGAMIPDGYGLMRVIPVESALEGIEGVSDYERISHYLDKYDRFSVSPCSCRASRSSLGDGCGHLEEDMCVQMGRGAEHYIRTGRAREITREQALEIIQRAEENGLMHDMVNIEEPGESAAICNCCACACFGLRVGLMFGARDAIRSNYVAEVDEAKCVACGQCVETCPGNALKLGQKLCSTEDLTPQPDYVKLSETIHPKRSWNPDYREDHEDVMPTGTAPCKTACPAHVPVQGYLKLAAQGRYTDALELIKKENPFPAVCGRICNKRCEAECTRGAVDEAVAIDEVKRFIADHDLHEATRFVPKLCNQIGRPYTEKIAVIGAGPAGMSCAYYLANKGYPVTVFDRNPVPGGMLTLGIPNFRLEKDVLNAEIDILREMGVEFRCGVEVGKDITIEQLREQGYKGFYVAIGAQKSARLGVAGEELIKISLPQNTELGTLSFTLKYDTKLLTYVSAEYSSGDVSATNSSTAGEVKINAVWKNAAPLGGEVAAITFKVNDGATGKTDFPINVDFSTDANNQHIDLSAVSSSIDLSEAALMSAATDETVSSEGKTVKAGKIPKTSGKYAAIGSAAAVLCVAAAAVAITVKRKRK